ncbi:MAG: hypothetical protein M1823_004025 [Watsoniomyces obsoletus]|nr:MAG: hypothetical protein M1823_004025 [Watsoniomyces obsoletus]
MASPVEKGVKGPLDLSHHFSTTTRNRKESAIKDFYKYFAIPDIGNLAGGLPNASFFPYDTLEASVALPTRFKPTPNHPTQPDEIPERVLGPRPYEPISQELPSSRVLVPKLSETNDLLKKIDIASALQYGTAQGYPPLASFIRRFTRDHLHPNVPYESGPEIILTCGNTDGFAKSLDLLSDVWSEEKDWIRERPGMLVEEFAYMNAIQAAAPRGLQIVPITMDYVGMCSDGPGGLRDILSNWDETKGRRPHLLYTVTIGQNPTGTTLTVKRRKALYELCQKYDIIIIEDDPYWYLQYPSAVASQLVHPGDSSVDGPGTESERAQGQVKGQVSSGYEFLDSLVPSYLSLDLDGRVIRLDTFSKTIAPGCRLGWITAQPTFIERILRINETTTQQPSGFVQSMVAELILGEDGRGWGMDGWVRWLEGLRGVYERRMQTMCRILDEGKYHVQSSSSSTPGTSDRPTSQDNHRDSWNIVHKVPMYDFHWPQGGMFVWLKLNLSSHPLYSQIPLTKLSHALWLHLTTEPYLVLVAPGTIFSPTSTIAETKGPNFFRLCFAAVDEDEVEVTSHRVVAAFNSFWNIRDLGDVDDEMKQAMEQGCQQM